MGLIRAPFYHFLLLSEIFRSSCQSKLLLRLSFQRESGAIGGFLVTSKRICWNFIGSAVSEKMMDLKAIEISEDVKLTCVEQGQGEPVIFVHGGFVDHHSLAVPDRPICETLSCDRIQQTVTVGAETAKMILWKTTETTSLL